MAVAEKQSQTHLQEPVSFLNQESQPYDNTTTENNDENSTPLTNTLKTDTEDYSTSQTNNSRATYPSQASQTAQFTCLMDTIQQSSVLTPQEDYDLYLQNCTLTPQMSTNYSNQPYMSTNSQPFNAILISQGPFSVLPIESPYVPYNGIPEQLNYQAAALQSRYMTYNTPRLSSKCMPKKETACSRKKKLQFYHKKQQEHNKKDKIGCEYFSPATSSDDEEAEEITEEESYFCEKSTLKCKCPTNSKKKSIYNDMVIGLAHQLMKLIHEEKVKNNESARSESKGKRDQTVTATEETSSVKLTVTAKHETTVSKNQDISETSERWIISSALRSNTPDVKNEEVTGWQPGSENITFSDGIIDGENGKLKELALKSEVPEQNIPIPSENPPEVNDVSPPSGPTIDAMGQGDSTTSNLQGQLKRGNEDRKNKSNNEANELAKQECLDVSSKESAETGCQEDLNEPKKKCNCCHCRAVNGDCLSKALVTKERKESSSKKSLELVSILYNQ